MKVSEQLTNTLYNLAKRDLAKVKNERSMASRVGLIIQAMRGAIASADLYIWSGAPHFFTGKIYQPIEVNEFKGCIYDVLAAAKMEPSDFTQIEKIQRISFQAVMAKPLRLRKDIIVFENCVLMLGDMTPADEEKVVPYCQRKVKQVIQSHSPELAQITMCHFDYDPMADCPKWKRFLENVLDNLQARMVLQEFLGCIFMDRRTHKFESMLILIGNGSNGKGVVSETVRGIVGDDSMTSFGLDSILAGQESLHNIAKMNGKRANWCTEIQAIQAGRFSDKLKAVISGEPIECRQMYGMPFTATDIPLMIANCNSLPPMQDKSYGMQRRFIIIRFDKTIPVAQQDKQLLNKLVPEYSGIFNWILEGRARYIDQHFQFTRCKSIEEAVQNYLENANNVEEWCTAMTYKPMPSDVLEAEPYLLPAKVAYDEYCRWCIAENTSPFPFLQFGSLITKMGFQKSRGCGGIKYRVYGEKALSRLTRAKKNELSKQLIENGGIYKGQELVGGRVYDVGDESASKQWHISRPYLTLLRKGHYLDGIWKKEPRLISTDGSKPYKMDMIIYDHIKLGQRLEAYGVYDQSADRRSLSDRRKDQVRRAESFNAVMKKEGKPFRKLTGKGSHYPQDAIFVDLDWEYTPDAAEALVDFYLKMKSEEKKAQAVKIDSRGRMNGAKKAKLLAEAIADKIDGVTDAKEGVDPETGEIMEVDIDDADLKIQ